MIGLYPLTGQTTFLIVAPKFASMTINLQNEKKLLITTTGSSQNSTSYVQSLKVNGQSWDKAWVTWDDVFANGGTMEYRLGSSPANWAAGDPPPSPASGL